MNSATGQDTDGPAEALAREILGAADSRRQIAPFSARTAGAALDMALAYRVTAALRRLRQARGERPIGRKIGFTNRTIWAEYGVYAPIWGDMYDTTLRPLEPGAPVDLGPFLEPRLEPEIAFGIGRAPDPAMDEAALLDCIDWVAHGFEIVHSVFPGWRFAAADTVAGFGLHGAYRIGPRHQLTSATRPEWRARLARFEIALARDGVEIDRGSAANVLGGPLSALRHLVQLLAADPVNPPLATGEIVTTGTVTRAFPVAAGETWRSDVIGLPIAGLEIRFA
ncbi:MAG TPA: fumarylacetoacetate hydrolase family protein [Alphaproteobacteria bacterium]|nr:fumarylacetoacetate hydrolase family protein [Alphaproteobacteria bacterium]